MWLISFILKYLITTWALFNIGKWLYKRLHHATRAKRKFAITQQHIKEVGLSLANFSLDSTIERLLPKASIKEIQDLLFSKTVTCVQLVKFFTKRAYMMNEDLNLVCDFMYEDAITLAEQRDKELQTYISQNKPLPPLFGIPISLKDVLDYKGIL